MCVWSYWSISGGFRTHVVISLAKISVVCFTVYMFAYDRLTDMLIDRLF